MVRFAGCLLLPLLLCLGCAPPAPSAADRCAGGLGQPMQMFELYFGRSIAGREDVTDREWTAFVEDIVLPALPNGFTILDARGAWRSPRSGRTIQEATKVILVALPETPANVATIDAIRSAYRFRFNQQLVGMATQPVCGSF